MRSTDLTDLRRKLEALLREAADQWQYPGTRDEIDEFVLAKRNLLDDVGDVLDEITDEHENDLDAAGIVRKQCAFDACGRWIVIAPIGRPREFCDDTCGAAARRARKAS
jgi:hypothetical protein